MSRPLTREILSVAFLSHVWAMMVPSCDPCTCSHAVCGTRHILWISLCMAKVSNCQKLPCIWCYVLIFFPVVSVCTQGWIQHNVLVSSRLVLGKLGPLGQIQSSFIQVNFYRHAYMTIYLGREWDYYHTIMTWKNNYCLFVHEKCSNPGPQYITF